MDGEEERQYAQQLYRCPLYLILIAKSDRANGEIVGVPSGCSGCRLQPWAAPKPSHMLLHVW